MAKKAKHTMEGNNLFHKWCWENQISYMQKNQTGLLSFITKINQKQIKDRDFDTIPVRQEDLTPQVKLTKQKQANGITSK